MPLATKNCISLSRIGGRPARKTLRKISAAMHHSRWKGRAQHHGYQSTSSRLHPSSRSICNLQWCLNSGRIAQDSSLCAKKYLSCTMLWKNFNKKESSSGTTPQPVLLLNSPTYNLKRYNLSRARSLCLSGQLEPSQMQWVKNSKTWSSNHPRSNNFKWRWQRKKQTCTACTTK